jgi:hypothetical protein
MRFPPFRRAAMESFVTNFLRAHMALSEQCRGYSGPLLCEPHVIVLNSPSRTDATIEPDSEEENRIDDNDGMVVDMEQFSCGGVSSLEIPQE